MMKLDFMNERKEITKKEKLRNLNIFWASKNAYLHHALTVEERGYVYLTDSGWLFLTTNGAEGIKIEEEKKEIL